MAEAENCRGECGGGLLVDITGGRETQTGGVRKRKRKSERSAVHVTVYSPLCPTPVMPG